MRGRRLLSREAPPSRSLPKRFVGARFWGGGGFSERSPSSPDPFSRRAAGVWGGCFFGVGSACELGLSPLALSESTAADRAAADMRRGGIRRHVHKHMTADARHAKPPLKGEVPAVGGRRGSFPKPHGRGGSVSRRDLTQAYRRRTQPTGGINSEATYQANRQPLFGSGGLGERRFSLRSGLSPRVFPHVLPTSQPPPMRRGRGGFGRNASGEERRASLRRGREQCLNRAPRGRWCLR